MNSINVVIVEDEPYAQKELKRLLINSSFDINVVECIDSVEDAINWINNNDEPDLMFFDIQLSDGLSFDIFNHIKTKTPIIFTTAFDEYAIKAFKVNSVDYLLKPVKQDELNTAIDKYYSLTKSSKKEDYSLRIEQIENLLNINKPRFKSRFITRIGDQIKYVNVDDIAYFKAEDNEVLLVTNDNKNYFVDYSLEQLNGIVNPDIFFRANRTYILNIASIKKISKYFNSRIRLEIQPSQKDDILISRVKVSEFLNWIEK